MKLKVIIVDDESHARSFLSKLCKLYYSDKLEVVDTCNSVESAVISIKTYNADIVFLDIQMPLENGFELLKYFEVIPFEIVFTTAYSNYALDAIKCSALDYLMKPIGKTDLESVLARYESKLLHNVGTDRYKLLKENILNLEDVNLQRMIISTNEGFEVLQLDNILYFTVVNKKTLVYTKDESFPISKTLKELDESLPSSIFIKTGKSFIVNKNYVKRFNSGTDSLEMINGIVASVSNSSFTKKKLMDALKK
jgi:two-component system LytT family response regulator